MANDQQPPTPFGQPTPMSGSAADGQGAADLIRQKLERIYTEEPGALQELAEAEAAPHRSKHQRFMYQLSTSGKDLATIQTEWHNYYQGLSDREKHIVWQEFYASQPTTQPVAPSDLALAEHKHEAAGSEAAKERATKPPKLRDVRSVQDVQETLRHTVSAGGKLQTKHHIQSLLFGLGMGLVAIFIVLFGFFNEVLIAPFIQPSRASASTPLIVSTDSVAPTATPEVIIPKINVEIPVDYSETSIDENAIENDLQNGVVHYPTTVLPGQNGNTAFFGHSSNNIFNKGKYKFAFVLLHTLVSGDTFYLTYNSKVYVYKVISRQIVDPSDVSVLGTVSGQPATATLITCDPPGTSLKRLVVVGQQISPDPAGNTQASQATPTGSPSQLPSEGPTLWTRIMSTTSGKAVSITILAVLLFITVRWINAPRRLAPQR